MDGFWAMYMSWEGESRAIADQLITFARRLCQGAPIKYRQLPAAALDETCAVQLSAAFVIGGPWTANISARIFWVIGNSSPSLRSRIIRSQRASRCVRSWAPLHAP